MSTLSTIIHSLLPLTQLSIGLFSIAILLKQITNVYKSSTIMSSKKYPILDFLLIGVDNSKIPTSPTKTNNNKSTTIPIQSTLSKPVSLLVSIIGLQVCYLVWGVLQEKLMTTSYGSLKEKFPSTSVLVLSNRIFAIVFSLLAMKMITQPQHRAPFVEYSFAAVANTISSWCQYEALRFVSFPMSTVSKACKIIPTMIMGTFIHGKRYPAREYLAAFIITIGVVIFALESGGGGIMTMLDQQQLEKLNLITAIPGGVLLIMYLIVDAFTSNWQNHLFKTYEISSYQCMLGINVFSTLLGFFNLAQDSSNTMETMYFLGRNPDACMDLLAMSLSSALGQLFIYYTIEKHGAVVFTIISVTRQLFSIALSSIMFGHIISTTAWIGVIITFSGVVMNLFSSSSNNNNKGRSSSSSGPPLTPTAANHRVLSSPPAQQPDNKISNGNHNKKE
jgi:adenosine 3'-phospho 5'-phosphosulfate transporter B2